MEPHKPLRFSRHIQRCLSGIPPHPQQQTRRIPHPSIRAAISTSQL
jgi:hypothetical protein